VSLISEENRGFRLASVTFIGLTHEALIPEMILDFSPVTTAAPACDDLFRGLMVVHHESADSALP
jgi:hypothetical protein